MAAPGFFRKNFPSGGYPRRPDRHRGGLQDRPVEPLAHGLCRAADGVRKIRSLLRFGDAGDQYEHLIGADDAQYPDDLCTVRARSHSGTHS